MLKTGEDLAKFDFPTEDITFMTNEDIFRMESGISVVRLHPFVDEKSILI